VQVGGPDTRWLGPLPRVLTTRLASLLGSQRLSVMLARGTKQDLLTLRDLMASGKVTPVIDRAYPLHELPAAMRHLESGHARGKVVVAAATSLPPSAARR
jgi:NADPH:quinone reductase-like Zn-dependent oxidoreductase